MYDNFYNNSNYSNYSNLSFDWCNYSEIYYIDDMITALETARSKAHLPPLFTKREISVLDKYESLQNIAQKNDKQEQEDEQEINQFYKDIGLDDLYYSPLGMRDDEKFDDDDDDDDECSICYLCRALNYKRDYNQSLCDSCTKCVTCSEYEDEECIGCKYSRYIDGKPYWTKIDSTLVIGTHDEDLYSNEDKSHLSRREREELRRKKRKNNNK